MRDLTLHHYRSDVLGGGRQCLWTWDTSEKSSEDTVQWRRGQAGPAHAAYRGSWGAHLLQETETEGGRPVWKEPAGSELRRKA